MKKGKFDSHPLRHIFHCGNEEESLHQLTFIAGYVSAIKIHDDLSGSAAIEAAEKLFEIMLNELDELFVLDPSITERDVF